ncbi:hypothetical protein FBU31_002174 [Coemansia sp. 'formosensis']|nr:hypothetical protein FBU31_002174 [Coemansia sp. 'formosensis']
MVSLFNYATVAALVAVCSVQVSGKEHAKAAKTSKCNPETATATQCVKSTLYKYCDDNKSIWVTATMEAEMSCDKNNHVVNPSSASVLTSGPAAMVVGVAVAIWQFL